MGDWRPTGIISGSLDLQLEGGRVGGAGAELEAEAGLAADGEVGLGGGRAGAEASQEPAGAATEGELVAAPVQADRAQGHRPVERRRDRLDGCALPPGWHAP